jgi:hypothetical protein
MNARWTATLSFAMLTIIALAAVAGAEEPGEKFRQSFSATAVAMGTSNPPILPPGRNARLDINITRWSTDAEREALFGELVENRQQGLITALRKQKETGWIRITGPTQRGGMTAFPSERFRYSREILNEDGSRRVVLAFDRPISMYEAVNRPRWRDYDMTLLVMDLDAEGNGVGQLAIGVQLEFKADTRTLVIENFGTEPVRLMNIRQVR